MAIGKEFFSGCQEPNRARQNLGVYRGDQIVIMNFYCIWGSKSYGGLVHQKRCRIWKIDDTEIGKEYSSGSQEPHQPKQNLGV